MWTTNIQYAQITQTFFLISQNIYTFPVKTKSWEKIRFLISKNVLLISDVLYISTNKSIK